MSVDPAPGDGWVAVDPGLAGVDAGRLGAVGRWLEGEIAAEDPYRVVVVRGGRMVAEWGRGIAQDERLPIHSAVKSVTSCMLAIAVAEGRLASADVRLVEVFPEALEVPEGEGPKAGSWAFPKDRAITLRQLIANTSGYLKAGEEPGRVFHYQSYGMTVLAHAIGRAYGLYDPKAPEASRYHELVTSRIRDPIGAGWTYHQTNFQHPPGAKIGVFGYYEGIQSNARDLARLGWLFCRRGRWGGRQLVPAEWLEEATRTSPGLPEEGPEGPHRYGFGFWANDRGRLLPGLPRDVFASWGSNRTTRSLIILVCPSRELVVALAPVPWLTIDDPRTGGLLGRLLEATTTN